MLEVLLFNSMICYGFRFVTSEGEALYFIRQFFEWLGRVFNAEESMEIAVKPLYGCVNCMASVWGVIGVALFGSRMGIDLVSFQTLGYLLALCGVNLLTGAVIAKLTHPYG